MLLAIMEEIVKGLKKQIPNCEFDLTRWTTKAPAYSLIFHYNCGVGYPVHCRIFDGNFEMWGGKLTISKHELANPIFPNDVIEHLVEIYQNGPEWLNAEYDKAL
jgi:hypothetical protein